MPRPPRADEAGGIDHALNRGNAREAVFHKDEDYFAFERILGNALERNDVRANLVSRAEEWRWGSLWRWRQRPEPDPRLLSAWPIPRPPNWVERVNAALTDRELQALRQSMQRGRPYGGEGWVAALVERLNLHSTIRPRGRQRVRFDGESRNKES